MIEGCGLSQTTPLAHNGTSGKQRTSPSNEKPLTLEGVNFVNLKSNI